MTAAPEYLYGDFKIRRQCAFVEDPEALRVEIEVRGANHPLFWIREYLCMGAGWYLQLNTYVEGLPDPLYLFKQVRAEQLKRLDHAPRLLQSVEANAFAEMSAGIARAVKQTQAAQATIDKALGS